MEPSQFQLVINLVGFFCCCCQRLQRAQPRKNYSEIKGNTASVVIFMTHVRPCLERKLISGVI